MGQDERLAANAIREGLRSLGESIEKASKTIAAAIEKGKKQEVKNVVHGND